MVLNCFLKFCFFTFGISIAKEKMVGWYHSGPKLRSSDLQINELFKAYNPNPVLVIIDVKPSDIGLPTDAYYAVDEVHDVSFLQSWLKI